MVTRPTSPIARFLCAHGAGGAMDSPFLNLFAKLLEERHIETLRFEFAYMAGRREGEKKRPPPKAETLIPEFRSFLAQAGKRGAPLLIGGKSMGGRIASLVADEAFAAKEAVGLVCLGYPFHPPNKPENLRTAHLEALSCPTLIVQGERDPFGPRYEIEAMKLSPAITLHWAPDGDHDLGPRGASGFTRKGNLAAAADAVAAFATRVGG
ncbi:MAG: alpha/beta hydrolase [Hyphomicrobiales bacterium]|nr:MAG: alpha/beta hydrolase [Hyphomicrobiales bacterium]